MIPHWLDAPEWAEWLAQDQDGDWTWFEYEPGVVYGPITFWSTSEYGGRWEWARKSPLISDWEATAYKRPETVVCDHIWSGYGYQEHEVCELCGDIRRMKE